MENMCPFVEKKEKSVVFSTKYKHKETAYIIFSTPSTPPPYYSNPLLLIIITMSNPPIIPIPHIIRDSRVYVIEHLLANLSPEYKFGNSLNIFKRKIKN